MSFLKRLLLRNFGLKATSLLLAILLWLQIAGQQVVQRSIMIPLEFINMPNDLEITNDYTRSVEIIISKPSSVRMDEGQLAAVVDLRSASPGTEVFPLTERNIRSVPSGVTVEGITQTRIRLDFERTRRKTVKVEARIVGQPAKGFYLREVRLIPGEVLVSGPESRLEGISTAQTAPITIAGRTDAFSQDVYIDLEDTRLRIDNANSVEVFVFIEEERKNVAVGRLAVRPQPRDAKVSISPRTVDLTVSVPRSFEGKLTPDMFTAVVRVVQIDANAESVEVAPEITVDEPNTQLVRVESIRPAKLKVTRVP